MTDGMASSIQPQLNDLLDHLPAGVVIHGVDGRLLNANRTACELIGKDIDQLRGMASSGETWPLFRSDGTRMELDDFPVSIVLRTGRHISGVVVGIGSLGVVSAQPEPVRWVICNAYPEVDARGALSRVIVCFTDCTAMKQSEQKLKQSEERLRLVLQGSTDASWDYDLIKDEIYYSDRWWGHAWLPARRTGE